MPIYEKDIESLEVRVIKNTKLIGDVYFFMIMISVLLVGLMLYLLHKDYTKICDGYDIIYRLTLQ